MAHLPRAWLLWTALAGTGSPSIAPRAQPSPLSVEPSDFIGNDGGWTAFQFKVGSTAQSLSLYASTASVETVAIAPQGCSSVIPNCESARGGIYDLSQSSNFKNVSFGQFTLEEDLDLSLPSNVGTDSMAIVLGSDTQSLSTQTVVAISSPSLWVGSVGLQPSSNDSSPGILSYLKSKDVIPSLSYGYTAGNQYRNKGVQGSLTLGGYDASRFEYSGAQYKLGNGGRTDLSVQIQSIKTDLNESSSDLLPSEIQVAIDTTLTDIWLPVAACEQFEDAFNIEWNSTYSFYTISDDDHNTLVSADPNITFTISDVGGGPTIDFSIPYGAFNLEATWPRAPNLGDKIQYFPLRRANSSDQYTLGRAFLQEIYLTVNYENSTFSMSPCTFDALSPDIIPIVVGSGSSTSNGTTSQPGPGPSSSNGSTIGIAVGVTLGVIAIVAVAGLLWWHRRRKQRAGAAPAQSSPSAGEKSAEASGPASRPDPQALPGPPVGQQNYPRHRLDELNTGIEHERYEAPGETPGSGPHGNEYFTPVSALSPRAMSPSELQGDASTRSELHSRAVPPPAELDAGLRAELPGSPPPEVSPIPSAAGSPMPQQANVSPLQDPQGSPAIDAAVHPLTVSPLGAERMQRPPIHRNPSSLSNI